MSYTETFERTIGDFTWLLIKKTNKNIACLDNENGEFFQYRDYVKTDNILNDIILFKKKHSIY